MLFMVKLLLSKHSKKQADTQIDFSNDEVKMLGKKLTTSGNYAIPIDNSTFIAEDIED